jgi:hypothetical protein
MSIEEFAHNETSSPDAIHTLDSDEDNLNPKSSYAYKDARGHKILTVLKYTIPIAIIIIIILITY